MDELVIRRRLEKVDREIHSIMGELKDSKQGKTTLSELNKAMEKDRISGEDSSNLIRSMRDKKYDL